MGYDWTQAELWEAFERIEQLEFLADIFPQPTWVPCIMTSIEVRQDVPQIEVAFPPSAFTSRLLAVYNSLRIEIQGLDQIKNRLRKHQEEQEEDGY